MVPNIFTLGVLATSLMFFWYIFQFAWIKWVCVSFYQMLAWQNFIGQQGYKEQTSGKNCRALKKWKSLHLKQGNGLTYGWWNSKLFTVFCCYKWRLDPRRFCKWTGVEAVLCITHLVLPLNWGPTERQNHNGTKCLFDISSR